MDLEKIEKIEKEIKKMYLNHPDENRKIFWSVHLKPVIDKSKELAEKYKGDLEIAWLAAILHDIGQLEALEPHEEIGSEKAYEILIEKNYGQEVAEKVKNVILTHRVNKHVPENLEQKILASADAICHFKTPHYAWMARISTEPIEKLFEKFANKLERDLNEKIFFEDEKETVRKEYEVLKEWFNSNIK